MAQNENQGTDARPLKPVSSLLSHFEGLKPQTPPPKLNERSPSTIRASFDFPRPNSPWNPNTDPARGGPQTPAGNPPGGRISPTRSGHKRPISMHLGSSPQLTPAVNIESPKSPPRTFFGRTLSRSPERADNTPFGKVRDLISTNSSRSSTRPSSSSADQVYFPRTGSPDKITQIDSPSGHCSRSPARPPPPPVNRAEKPKIPAKPLGIAQPAPQPQARPRPQLNAGRLTPEPISAAPGARISPFSTPPSSEASSPEQSPSDHATELPNLSKADETPRLGDPRYLGFNSVGVPARSNTVGERKPPREIAPPKRHVSEQVQPPKPQVRDPRQLGFSSHAPTTPVQEDRPGLPTRHTVLAPPPPRPSEESKNIPPKRQSPVPVVTERSRQPPQSITVERQRQPSQSAAVERPKQAPAPQVLRSVPPPPSDIKFPPPPKRNTFNSEDERSTVSNSKSRSNTLDKTQQSSRNYAEDSDEAEASQEPTVVRMDYPDATQTNRRPPYNLSGAFEIKSRADGRVFDICGRHLCVSGYITRVFDMSSGEQVLAINHGDTVKVSSVKFKPGVNLNEEGKRLWIGNNIGELHEIDIDTHAVVASSLSHGRRDVIRILRHNQNLWTLDEDGKLHVWHAVETGIPNLKYSHVAHKVPRGHTFSMVVKDKLWLATGKEIRIYKPGNEASFTAITSPLVQANIGDVTSGTCSNERGGRTYFGHADGKISMYSTSDYSCLGVIKASDYKITGLSFVGDRLWAAYKTGKVYVYDTSCMPWKVKKDWHAHAGPISGMLLDPSSVWTLSRLQVVTAGQDDVVRLWDATLEEDWMEAAMQERDVEYCTFREVKAAVVTWNVGAVVPSMVRSDFVSDAIHSEDPPEILAFGFQEVVDLEDKATTAKSLLGFTKKKDTTKAEQQSRVYREWRDYLARSISRFTNTRCSYSELQTSSLVGLFQCVFIRQEERRSVSSLSATNVKCGMGGHYGNKGALITRFVLDDSSLCFINCHLAAGQTQTTNRNYDIATILESEGLPVESNRQLRSSLFVGGGDGSQVLDHEICILNGDLNYRIDTVPRDTVINMIKRNELPKLLERDQIMVCRRRLAGFRLAPFAELPITFAPTYKYDVGTDNYDSSEKKRSPAWCDRLLYRGPGRIKQTEYVRHEVRVSDHRPVSGFFKIRIKKVDVNKQERVRQECFKQFQLAKKQLCEGVCIRWLVEAMGVAETEAKKLIAG